VSLEKDQLEQYSGDGFILLPEHFTPLEVDIMRRELPAIFDEDSLSRVTEKDGHIVRSVYGSHATNEVFRKLTQHPRVVEPARQILQSEVYIYQFKINAKVAFEGDLWQWHQDYIFWRKEDGMPSDRVINVLIFLDEVNEFNGPLFLIPKSHREGMIDVIPQDELENGKAGKQDAYKDSPSWISNLTADLKYSLSKETVRRLAARNGLVAPKGPAGSVLFFHGNLMHGSANNISPFDRMVIIITYNSTENIPIAVGKLRPDFLVGSYQGPIVALSDDVLLS